MNTTIEIISKKKNIPFDFWKNPKVSSMYENSIIHFDNLDNSLIQEIYQNESSFLSSGYLVSYRGNIYAVTCYHGIKNCYEFSTTLNKTNLNLKIYFECVEFDIAILAFEKDINDTSEVIKNYNVIDIFTISTEIPELNTKIKLNTMNSKFLNYIEGQNGNELFTTIPQIIIERPSELKTSKVFGVSGSPCFLKKTYIGQVFSYNMVKDVINVIPSYCLKYIFMFMIPNKITNLKTILLDGDLCKIKEDSEKLISAYKMNKSNQIDYSVYDKEDKHFNFKKNSIIYEIDKLEFNNEGKIYFKDMNVHVSPYVYVLLNNHKTYFEIKGYDFIGGNYEKFDIIIEPTNLINNMIFTINGHKKIVIYKNMVFAELSREMIELVKVINKDSSIREKLENPYTKRNSKQIVLIDIFKNKLNSEKNTNDSNLNKLMKHYSTNNLIFVNKVNKKGIDTLEELMENISKTAENNFTFEVKKATYKNLDY
jgi:hypothetical protein